MHVHGHVQGVGFRAWAGARMRRLGLTGGAENQPDGTVDIRLEGAPGDVERFVAMIRSDAPGRVEQVVVAVGGNDPAEVANGSAQVGNGSAQVGNGSAVANGSAGGGPGA